MIRTRTVAASLVVLMLGACGTMEAAKMKATKAMTGVTATECFSSAGTIDNSTGTAMCKMKDGSAKPIK